MKNKDKMQLVQEHSFLNYHRVMAMATKLAQVRSGVLQDMDRLQKQKEKAEQGIPVVMQAAGKGVPVDHKEEINRFVKNNKKI